MRLPLLLTCIWVGLPALAESPPEVEVSESSSYYRLDGSTIPQLRQQIRAFGPVDSEGKHRSAFTIGQVKWAYRYSTDSSGGCKIGPVIVTVFITFRFPLWYPPSDVSREVADKWRSFDIALHAHEDGHKAIWLETARRIRDSLQAIPAQPSCDELQRVVDADGARLSNDAKEENRRFDETTFHGATRGVRLQ